MIATLQQLLGAPLSLLPESLLRRTLIRALDIAPRWSVSFYFSGRVALYRLALANKQENTVALVPDYVCNVVAKSFQEAGIPVETFPINNDFEPDIHDLKQRAQRKPHTLLCLAPVMGADGGINWALSPEGLAWRQQNNITLFVDISQAIYRFKQLSHSDAGSQLAFIASFNDKAFRGAMGAIVATDLDDPDYSPQGKPEQAKIRKLWLRRLANPALQWISKQKNRKTAPNSNNKKITNKISNLDYSHCVQFPYTFAHSGAGRLQIAVALAGVWLRPYYQYQKKQYIKQGFITPKKTPYYLLAPYLVTNHQHTSRLKAKAPYAKHNRPTECHRPHLRAYHCKGFSDWEKH